MKVAGSILASLGLMGLVAGIVQMIDAFNQAGGSATELAGAINQAVVFIGLGSGCLVVGGVLLLTAIVNRRREEAEEAVLNGAATHRSKG